MHWRNALPKLGLCSVLPLSLFLLKAGTHNAPTKCHPIYEKHPHGSIPEAVSALPHDGIPTFHIKVCFPSHPSLPTPPSSCISDSTRCQEQNRDSWPQTAQPQVWSHLPFQAGSTTRVSVITEPALSLLHCGTISYFKLLPFKFWNNHMQAGAKPLQIPLPLQQPFQNLHFSLLL